MPEALHYLSLDEVARRLKARRLTSVEATRAILDRIEAIDSRLGSYATVTAERALAEAARFDTETAAGKSRGRGRGAPQVPRQPPAQPARQAHGLLEHRSTRV